MVLNLLIPATFGEGIPLRINAGDVVYVLGPNGSGKSSLMQYIASNGGNVRWISAHRTNWLESSNLLLSGQAWKEGERGLSRHYRQQDARTKDRIGSSGPNIALYALFNLANNINAQLAEAYRSGDLDEAERLKATPRPLDTLNTILRRANIHVQLHHDHDHALIATKNGVSFPANRLSDGERNALLLAAEILTVSPRTIILLDEPERHLHNAISSSLLNQLFRTRSDCSFIIATHALDLPLETPSASLLLTRNCGFKEDTPNGWEADFLPNNTAIPEPLTRDIMGGRRKVIFVEGEQDSLDLPLYSLIFPGFSVIAKQTCKDVKNAVSSLQRSAELHWIKPFGIVDHDGQTPETVSSLAEENVFALPVFSVESIYYHPQIQKMISERVCKISGGDPIENLDAAKLALLESFAKEKDRLCARAVEHKVRAAALSQLPNHSDILAATVKKSIDVDTGVFFETEKAVFETAYASQDIATLISRYPLRRTPARNEIAKALGFQGHKKYEDAVIKLIEDIEEAREFVKSMFGDSYRVITSEDQD